ncbi:unnamed protein product [Vitrella brassicaformis CCMP3155]|uniref:PABS domain-containing protein n=2 Tax=Vitrella brassicaformis TaxID=1169539 RepID=A0A0G4F4Z1_VITBC|nr:unnamed protein product [Vitrella brassicaformis CCMP3155]|eukprot:CEM07001.1 unnamed protein product [Vitrella brassicaformis CCMP3155]
MLGHISALVRSIASWAFLSLVIQEIRKAPLAVMGTGASYRPPSQRSRPRPPSHGVLLCQEAAEGLLDVMMSIWVDPVTNERTLTYVPMANTTSSSLRGNRKSDGLGTVQSVAACEGPADHCLERLRHPSLVSSSCADLVPLCRCSPADVTDPYKHHHDNTHGPLSAVLAPGEGRGGRGKQLGYVKWIVEWLTDQCSSPSPVPFSPNAVRPAIKTHTHIREVSSRPPLNVLIIGFGGGVMAQRVWEGCHDTPRGVRLVSVDVVSNLLIIAEGLFGFQHRPKQNDVSLGEGCLHALRRLSDEGHESYDVIIVDALGPSYHIDGTPNQCSSVEAVGLVTALLRGGGVAIHRMTRPWSTDTYSDYWFSLPSAYQSTSAIESATAEDLPSDQHDSSTSSQWGDLLIWAHKRTDTHTERGRRRLNETHTDTLTERADEVCVKDATGAVHCVPKDSETTEAAADTNTTATAEDDHHYQPPATATHEAAVHTEDTDPAAHQQQPEGEAIKTPHWAETGQLPAASDTDRDKTASSSLVSTQRGYSPASPLATARGGYSWVVAGGFVLVLGALYGVVRVWRRTHPHGSHGHGDVSASRVSGGGRGQQDRQNGYVLVPQTFADESDDWG